MQYHAFACYNSRNRQEVRTICEYLTNSHFRVFLDTTHLFPGAIHTKAIDDAVRDSETILVFIGPQGLGPWQQEEVSGALWSSVRETDSDPNKVIIPILLPDADITHENVPLFLRSRTFVKFSKNVEEEEPLQKLIEGLLRDRIYHQEGQFEKPVTQHEFDKLLRSTIKAYDTPKSAERFYSVWKDEIPFAKLELLEKRLSSGARILDAGCGPGHHSHYLARKGFDVTGVDLSKESLAIAKKTGARVHRPIFYNGDMREVSTSFRKNYFDAVWACGSCVHTPDAFLDRQLREFLSVLRPGGYLGITLQVSRLPAIEQDGRFFEGYYDQSEVSRYLELSKFKILNIETDVTKRNTHGTKNIVNWIAAIAQVPEKAVYLTPAALRKGK